MSKQKKTLSNTIIGGLLVVAAIIVVGLLDDPAQRYADGVEETQQAIQDAKARSERVRVNRTFNEGVQNESTN